MTCQKRLLVCVVTCDSKYVLMCTANHVRLCLCTSQYTLPCQADRHVSALLQDNTQQPSVQWTVDILGYIRHLVASQSQQNWTPTQLWQATDTTFGILKAVCPPERFAEDASMAVSSFFIIRFSFMSQHSFEHSRHFPWLSHITECLMLHNASTQ